MIFGTPPIVTNGLVLNLDAANMKSYPKSGTTWRDLSGLNNSGSLVNGPTFSSANGGSIVFDGVDDRVDCGFVNQITGLTNLTVSAWVFPVTSSSTYYVSRYFNTTSHNGFFLYSFLSPGTTNIKFGFDGRESISGYLFTTSSLDYSLNQWHNMTATKNANNWRVYVNSILVASNNVGDGTTAFQQNPLQVGALVTSFGTTNTRSNIAQVQIYNRALSPSEIQQNYNAQKSRFNL